MTPRRIHCVCGGFGFPFGTASTKRVMLMGRALHAVGVPFHVWHIGSSSYPENTEKKGTIHGLSWEYLSPGLKRPQSKWRRLLFFLYGCLLLPIRLAPHRREICVYGYYQGDLINAWILLVCRLLRIPVAQECCEWWPGTPEETRYNRWIYQHLMFRWSSGSLAISSLIENRIRAIAGSEYPILRVPVLVDADEVNQQRNVPPSLPGLDPPYLFWCGMVDGYRRDPLFLIQVLAKVKEHYGRQPQLVLSGPCSNECREELLAAAAGEGLAVGRILITGFIEDAELFRLATHAMAFLLPLWHDERSQTRFPTKVGLFAAAGKPVITSRIGEIPYFFVDGQTALFAPPGEEEAWADRINLLMQDEQLRAKMAEQVLTELLPRFEYRQFGTKLQSFFLALANHQKKSNIAVQLPRSHGSDLDSNKG